MSTPADFHFDPDDPRLTAYALGELPDPADRAHVEAVLAASPEARAELADIRSLTATLTAEYEHDRLSANESANVIRLPNPRRAWVRSLLAAAAVLLLAGLLVPVTSRVLVKGLHSPAVFSVSGNLSPSSDAKLAPTGPMHLADSTPPAPAFKSSSDSLASTGQPTTGLDLEVAPIDAPKRNRREEVLGLPAGATSHIVPFAKSAYANSATPLLAAAKPLTLLDSARRAADYKDASQVLESGPPGTSTLPLSGDLAAVQPTDITMDQNRANSFGSIDRRLASRYTRDWSEFSDSEDQRYSSVAAASAPEASADSVPQPSSPSKTKLIQKSSPRSLEVATADRVTVTGSNVPTSEEVGVAPVDTVDQAARDRTGQEDVLAVLTRSAPAVASGGGNVGSSNSDVSSSLALRGSAQVPDDSDGTINDKPAAPGRRPAAFGFNTAAYDHVTETPFLAARENPLSTFSVDVDTASYSIVRRFIEGGSLPPAGAVRIEEMLNYFPYNYAPPAPGDEHPFAVHLEGAACPWNPDHRLVRVALKGREIAQDKRPPSNLVFLLDVSGSMEPPERLPLIKESLRLLVEKLTDNDRVAIVVYAGNSGLVLPSTNGAHKDTILQALDHLEAGGSTNGASGIKLAYKAAQQNFLKGGTNRVILATDGDFNVGTTSQGELVRLIEKEAKGGVFLSVLGVGTDNLKDSTMQKLADHGNGNYAYLDGIAEGRKVLVEQMSGTLVTIAKDVKIQVEFNPVAVNSYRLIGYEKRLLRKEDFNDDRVDAGEIGAGHSVTALYEVVPTGQTSDGSAPAVDALKYQAVPSGQPVRAVAQPADTHELLTVKIRHKAPDSETSERSYEVPFTDHGTANDYANASPDFKFAAAVATFGMVLRDSPYKGNATLGAAIELAQDGKGADPGGYRAGFIELARRAAAIQK